MVRADEQLQEQAQGLKDELRRSVALLGVRVVRMLDYAEGDLDRVDFDQLVADAVRVRQYDSA